MADIITDTSITPILSSDYVDESVANTAHDELKAMMDEIQAHHNGNLDHGGSLVITGGNLDISNNAPRINIIETDGTTDNKVWGFSVSGETLHLLVRNDAEDSFSDILTVDRTGTVVDTMNIKSTTLQHNGVDVITAVIKQKVVEMGDWDMQAGGISIAHGLTRAKILTVTGIIWDDSNSVSHLLTQGQVQTPVELQGYINSISDTNILLDRKTGGLYDSTNYNDVGGTQDNRGYLTITYLP